MRGGRVLQWLEGGCGGLDLIRRGGEKRVAGQRGGRGGEAERRPPHLPRKRSVEGGRGRGEKGKGRSERLLRRRIEGGGGGKVGRDKTLETLA